MATWALRAQASPQCSVRDRSLGSARKRACVGGGTLAINAELTWLVEQAALVYLDAGQEGRHAMAPTQVANGCRSDPSGASVSYLRWVLSWRASGQGRKFSHCAYSP